MAWQVRRAHLISQRIEVALVYKDMLGLDEAIDYLERERISRAIAERVLFTDQRRPSACGPYSTLPPAEPFTVCRRKNHVHHAIVEAALKIEQTLGTHVALTLMRNENVPEEVAARIITRPPGKLRGHKPG